MNTEKELKKGKKNHFTIRGKVINIIVLSLCHYYLKVARKVKGVRLSIFSKSLPLYLVIVPSFFPLLSI